MKVIDLYNKLTNPIDNEKVLNFLLDKYSNSTDYNTLYKQLILKDNKKTDNQSFKEELDMFYVTVFNEWKRSIIEMSFKRFSNLLKNEKYKKDFSKMREFLEKIPEVKTKDDIDKIIYDNYKPKDEEIAETLKTYYWVTLPDSDWVYVSSRLVTIKEYIEPEIKHNLYININNSHIYGFATKFFEKCTEYKLPYFFKFNKSEKYVESIIITCDSRLLMFYIKILDEIKRENPEFVEGAKNPSPITGRISSWLGYASEPKEDSYKTKYYPFYFVRAIALCESFDKITSNWVKKNINNDEYKSIIQNLIVNKISEKNSKIISDELKDAIGESIEDFINDYCENKLNGIDISDSENDKTVSLSQDEITLIIKKISVNFFKTNKDYISEIQNEIATVSKKYGIDSKKFCFDEDTIKED